MERFAKWAIWLWAGFAAAIVMALLANTAAEIWGARETLQDEGWAAFIRATDAAKVASVAGAMATMAGLTLAAFAGYYKFQLFREGKRHLTIDLQVSHRPITNLHTHVGATAVLKNTSKVAVRVEEAKWELAAVAPYEASVIDNKKKEFSEGDCGRKSDWQEFPWNIIDEFTIPEKNRIIEPGESDEITFDFIAPATLEAAAVSLFIPNSARADADDAPGWYRRTFHDLKGK